MTRRSALPNVLLGKAVGLHGADPEWHCFIHSDIPPGRDKQWVSTQPKTFLEPSLRPHAPIACPAGSVLINNAFMRVISICSFLEQTGAVSHGGGILRTWHVKMSREMAEASASFSFSFLPPSLISPLTGLEWRPANRRKPTVRCQERKPRF